MPAERSEGILWFTSSPGWLPNLLIMGLIGLIPIVGVMNIYGYAMATARNIRGGYRVLPPANLDYLGRGAPVAVLSIAWAFAVLCIVGIIAGIVAAATHAATNSTFSTIALTASVGIALLLLLQLPMWPLLTPALEMSDREGWRIFHVPALFRHAWSHWRGTWYGAAILLLWYAITLVFVMIASVVPFGGILAAIVTTPLLAPLAAIPIARFDDPPAGFGKGAANLVAAAWLVIAVFLFALPLGGGLIAYSIINSHPREVACIPAPGCTFRYNGNLEVIATVKRQGTLVTVDATYINGARTTQAVVAADYSASFGSDNTSLAPNEGCPVPQVTRVEPGQELTQHVCFTLPTATTSYSIHLPWVGWDYNSA